jgi:hypothetical protein
MFSIISIFGRSAVNAFTGGRIIAAVLAIALLLLFVVSPSVLAQDDDCTRGYAILNCGTDDSVHFEFTGSARICYEQQLGVYLNPCLDRYATVRAGVFNANTGDPVGSVGNCTGSPLYFMFQADTPSPSTGNCPSGSQVNCCCLPAGTYTLKILGPDPNGGKGGPNYAPCYTGHIKVCIDCHYNCP